MSTSTSVTVQVSMLDLPRPDGVVTGISFEMDTEFAQPNLPTVADDGRISFGAGLRLPRVTDKGRVSFGAGLRLPRSK